MEGNTIQFNLKEELVKYFIFWKWILLSLILSILVAFIYLRYVSDIYATQAKIQILDQSNNTFKLPTNAFTIFGENDKQLENEIELFKSTRIFNKVIDSLDLQTEIFAKGKIKSIEVWDTAPFKVIWGMSHDELEANNLSFEVTLLENGYQINASNTIHPYNKTNLTLSIPFNIILKNDQPIKVSNYFVYLKNKKKVIQELSNNLTITKQGAQSNILKINLKGGNTSKINTILNTLIGIFDEDGVKDRQMIYKKTIQFVDDRFRFLFTELDSIENEKASFKKSKGLSFLEADAGVLMEKNYSSKNEVEKIDTQIVLSDLMLNAINNSKEHELIPVNIGITNEDINNLSSKLNEVILNRNKFISDGGGKTNPIIVSLSQQSTLIKNNLKSTIFTYKNTLNYQKQQLVKINGLSYKDYNRIPDNEKSLRSIERQQNIKESLYILLLQKREEAAVNLAITNPTIKLIELPNTSSNPIAPDRSLIYILAFITGLLIPILIIYFYYISNDKIQTKSELESRISLPILGEIPFVESTESKLIKQFDRSVLSESFRILRTNISFLLSNNKKQKSKVIYVTSSVKGEGKTFTSVNLAISMNATKKRVILVGADLRNPQLHTILNFDRKNNKGISNYIFDEEMHVDEIIISGSDEQLKNNFDVIFSGTIPPNPAELLSSNRFLELIEILKEKYDYIIVDTAPTLLVTDTTLISGLADAIVFVTRANFTEKKLLKHIEDFQKINPTISFGILLNNVGQNKIYSSSYSYSYNYGYGYGYEKNYSKKLPFKFKFFRWLRSKKMN